MGFDGVELVMSIEDEFDIKIEDEATPSLQTLGEMARYVTWQTRSKWPRLSCPTTKTFYEIRRLLLDKISVKRRDIRPSARLDELIPWWLRRRFLRSLERRSLWMPELRRPRVLVWLGIVLALAAGVLVGISIGLFAGILDGVVCGSITLYAIGIAIYWITIPLTACFQPGYETVGDLVRRVTPNYDVQDEIDASVFDRVRKVISDQRGIAIEKLAAQTRFAEDLHVD